ncbi:MAG: PQQ-binding-like beta-propeller repeat protein [Verrucomicrobiota bacterium]|jgi:outer membrane protein assembly factor BamB
MKPCARLIFALVLLMLWVSGGGAYSQDDAVFVAGARHQGTFDSRPVTNTPSVVWKYEMPYSASGEVVLYQDRVLAGCHDRRGNKEYGVQFALDKNTGKVIWQRSMPEQLSAPSVAAGTAYYGSKLNRVVALKTDTGIPIWECAGLKGPVCSPPAVLNHRVFFGNHGKEWCVLDATTGKLIRQLSLSNGICCYPSMDDGKIFFVDWDGQLHRYDSLSLEDSVIYQAQKPSEVAPTIAKHNGCFFTEDGVLYVVNLMTGKLLWTFRADGQVWQSPAIAGNVCVFVTDKGHIYALDTGTGSLLWDIRKTGAVNTSASITEQTVYVGGGNHSLYAFQLTTGRELWEFQTADAVSTPWLENGVAYFSSGKWVYAIK